MPASRTITVGNDVEFELLLGQGRQWLGVGAVTVTDTPLRCAERPMVLRIDTPEGILYTRLLLDEIASSGKEVHVRFRAFGRHWGRQEFLDEYQQQMWTVGASREDVEDEVTLKLKPATLKLAGKEWTGFAWSFAFKSAERRIHRILVDGSWELGGSIEANTVLSQGQCNMPVYRGRRSRLFTTACLKTLDQYGSPQGVSYQLGPRAGLIQGFDFQHGKLGALLQFWPKLGSISSILESPKGSDLLHVTDEYRGPLGRSVSTPWQLHLLLPGVQEEHEARDLWWEAREYVYGKARAQRKISASVVRPEQGVQRYSTRLHRGRLRVSIMGEEVEANLMLHLVADRLLPRLAEQGFKRLFPIDANESDVTALGLRRKLDNGIHGDLHVASVCGTHRFFPSEFWGGIKGWRHMADKARSLGMEIGTWFAPHFSPRAPIFEEHPEWLLTGPDTHAWSGGYHHAIATADWNAAIYDWVLDDYRRWVEEGGLDYIFVDSWANMGLLQMNYSERMRTNLRRLGELLHEIQELGVRAYSFEGISAYGYSRFGVRDLRGDLLKEQQGVAGQNDFGWWAGEMDMAFDVCMHAELRKRSEQEAHELEFRAMANRGYLMLSPYLSDDYAIPDWWAGLNRIYELVLPHMQRRRLLPDGQGVLWDDGETQVIWAFKQTSVPVPHAAHVERVDGPEAVAILCDGRLPAQPWSVYRITPRA